MKKLVLSGLVVLLVAGLSCTEERTIIRPVETETVHLQGVLYGWMCGVGDGVNNPGTKAELLFSTFTGESASITLVRDNGFTTWFETDDSSRFNRFVSAGTYKVIIKTGYTWPEDTILNVHLTPGDTVLELDISYDVLDPERISFYFQYPTIDDTSGLQHELETVVRLNSAAKVIGLPCPLNIYRTTSPEQFSSYRHFLPMPPSRFYVIYDIPIIRLYEGYYEGWNVMQAYQALQYQIDVDTTRAFFNLSINPRGVYACLY
jgi:hypothetical protein